MGGLRGVVGGVRCVKERAELSLGGVRCVVGGVECGGRDRGVWWEG